MPESQTLVTGLRHPSYKEEMGRKVKLLSLVYDILPPRRKWAGKSNSCHWFTTSFLQGGNGPESQTLVIGLRHPSFKEEMGRKVKLLSLVYDILPPRRKSNSSHWFTTSSLQGGKWSQSQTLVVGLRHLSSKEKMCRKVKLLTLVYAILPPRRKLAGKSNSWYCFTASFLQGENVSESQTPNIGLRHPSSGKKMCQKAELLTLKMCRKVK